MEFIFWAKNLQQDNSFCKNIVKIQSISKLWDMRQLTLEERITVSKSLAVYKAINLLLVTKLRNDTTYLLYKIQKNFVLQGKKGKNKKFKHSTLLNSYEKGGLKNVELRNKRARMKWSWIKRLPEDDFHDRKVISLFLIGEHLSKNFKIHKNVDVNNCMLSKCPSFYQDIFIK